MKSFDDPKEFSEDIKTSKLEELKPNELNRKGGKEEQQSQNQRQTAQRKPPQIQEERQEERYQEELQRKQRQRQRQEERLQEERLQEIQRQREELQRQQRRQRQIQKLQRNPEEILSSYRLGKGDFISIKVFGEADFSVKTHLSKEGTISYPFLGELTFGGKTVSQVEKMITRGLRGDYLVNPKVTVTVLEYRKLFVNGEVKNPGGFAFVPGMTVNKAISLAGGFTESASREEIFIISDGNKTGTPLPADLKTYVGPGDILIVKEYQKFFVDGEVRKPGSYVFVQGLTVKKAISVAGGFTDRASREEIFIIHKGEEETKSPVNLHSSVTPGDIITVKEYKKIFVTGEVKNPGSYDYIQGLTVKKAISIAGGFSIRASRDDIFILHKGEEETKIPVNLHTEVEPGDIVTVKEYKKIFLNGEVQKPGSYDYIPELTVEKAISIAGGFTKFGSPRWSKILILRDGDKTEPVSVSLNTPVHPGDIITVEESTF
jgi:polysaccharide export outer membrane protein